MSFGRRIKALGVGNETEYINLIFNDFLSTKDIQLETTALYIPQRNGRYERERYVIVESVRSIQYFKELPVFLWAETVNTGVYILKRTLTTQGPDSTVYQLWFRVSALLSFGS